MYIRYGCELGLVVCQPTSTFCLVDVHPERRPDILMEQALRTQPDGAPLKIGHDAFGNIMQRCLLPAGETLLRVSGIVRDSGEPDEREIAAVALSPLDLPDDVAVYLKGSRYCETDEIGTLAWSTFGHLAPGAGMVQAICDFTHGRLAFDYQRARSTRTALQAYQERTGVCRDFTHLAIALCRAMNIPARYVNGYLGDIGVPADPAPMDFNAWFEVYLGGKWYTYDARHNQRRIGRIVIARGRDACDVPMVHTFGSHVLRTFRVTAEEVTEPRFETAA